MSSVRLSFGAEKTGWGGLELGESEGLSPSLMLVYSLHSLWLLDSNPGQWHWDLPPARSWQ